MKISWANWANRITIARILFIPPFVILMLKMHEEGTAMWRYAALVIFVLMAISDWVDGYLARKKKLATTLGAFLTRWPTSC